MVDARVQFQRNAETEYDEALKVISLEAQALEKTRVEM